MSPYDILMIVVLLAATIFGAWKGMAWQLASLASLVLSYFAALKFSPQLAPLISDQAPWNRFVAMLVIYLGTSVAIWPSRNAVSGVGSAGLRTTVQPAASAGAIFQAAISRGKFQGMIWPQTPIGWRSV